MLYMSLYNINRRDVSLCFIKVNQIADSGNQKGFRLMEIGLAEYSKWGRSTAYFGRPACDTNISAVVSIFNESTLKFVPLRTLI